LRTSSGIAIQRSADISCSSTGPGKIANICSGATGLTVTAPAAAVGGVFRSATMLYQWVGISLSSSTTRVLLMRVTSMFIMVRAISRGG
jgi:hypothetical protein